MLVSVSAMKAAVKKRFFSSVSTEARELMLLDLFKSCSNMRELKQLHAQIVRTGFDQDVFVAGRVISFCAVSESGSMDHAVSVFQNVRKPDGFLWNTMIRGFGRTNMADEAFLYYGRMRRRGEVVDSFTFSFVVKVCGQLMEAELGRQVHCDAVKHGLDSHVYVRNTLVHMYGLVKDLGAARFLFDEMVDKDLVSWNTVIDGYVQCGEREEALSLFLQMRRSGFTPDETTLVVVLSACSDLGDLDFGRRVHSSVKGSGLDRIVSVSNTLIDMYAKCGAIDKAIEVFEAMKDRNVVSWNSIISGLAVNGRPEDALELFSRMQGLGSVEPNDVTFVGVLSACSHGGLVEEGRRYFESMRTDHCITPTVVHYGCMVDLLSRAGLVREAYELIRSMPLECNAVVWKTLLAACRVHADLKLAERVRLHLLELGPDCLSTEEITLSHPKHSMTR